MRFTKILVSASLLPSLLLWPVGFSRATDTPGVTATEIKLGQTMPYSGPASSFSIQGKVNLAYLNMINEQGGINGRKINLISRDDGYSPPKAVEQIRKLVEEDNVAAVFGMMGTPGVLATAKYLNSNGIPRLATFPRPVQQEFPFARVLRHGGRALELVPCFLNAPEPLQEIPACAW